MNTISKRPLVQMCDVGEASATLVFTPAEVDIDKVLRTAKSKLREKSFGTIRLREMDLELGLLQLYWRPGLNGEEPEELKTAAELVANELARTCVGSPSFDVALYGEPA